MTTDTLTIDEIEEKPVAVESPQPRRTSRGSILLYAVVALILFSLAVPVLVAVAVIGYFFLGAAPAKPQPQAATELEQVLVAAAAPAVAVQIAPPRTVAHPLDEALRIAHDGLQELRANVNDYTATLVSRERIGGKLKDEQTMFLKVRSPKKKDEELVTPLSVYLKFTAPKDKAGREVIYVAGQNNNKIVGHETGFLNITRYYLRPEGPVAMMGERYPITEIGVERLTEQLIERGLEERRLDPRITKVEVTVDKGIKYLGRKCTRIKMRYPHRIEQVEFHSAEICIDEEHFVPIYYVAYSWPLKPGGEAVLEEEYTYKDLKVNVGLKDADFDPDNKAYKFP